MNQMTRTLAFVIAASASVIGAVVTHVVTKPPVAVDIAHQQIGQSFYPGFTEPTKVTGVKVAAWNPRSGKVEEFEVRHENGRWRIPSHQNYPADDTDQLAKAAASAVGIMRGSLVSESAETFERMGLIDPLDGSAVQGPETTGTRVVLYEGDQAVADYIIGHRPGEDVSDASDEPADPDDDSGKQAKEGTYYVRLPKENLVYLAEVKIDISTRFRDWIKKDLLDLSQFDLRRITVNRYSVDEAQGTIVKGDISELERETSSEPWKLGGLDEAKEQVKAGVVSAMARALDDLQIIDVERKPAPLVRYFTEGAADVVTMLQIQPDLMQHGFFFGGEGNRLWANEGEILAGTREGVTFVLQFGEVFTGSDLDVSVGSADNNKTADKPAADAATAAEGAKADDSSAAEKPADDAAKSDAETEQKPDSSTNKRSRYVIVEAVFDPSLLGPEPTKPTPPVKAAPAAPTADRPADAKAADEEKPADAKPTAKEQPAAETPTTEKSKAADAQPVTNDTKPDVKPAEGAAAKEDKAEQPAKESNCDDAPADATAEKPSAESTTPAADAKPKEADAAPEKKDASKSDDPKPSDAKPETPAGSTTVDPAASQPASEAADGNKPVIRPKTPDDIYQEELKQYEKDLEAYEAKKKDYDQRLTDGQKKVDELNKRFAEWYYVISADLFEDLSVTLDQLVEPKSADAAGEAPAGGSPLDLQGLNIPGLNLPGGAPPQN